MKIVNTNKTRLAKAREIAYGAGKILLQFWRKPIEDLQVQYKVDQFDPVTLADQGSDAYIREQICAAFSEDLILSEENEFTPEHYDGYVWMVDPLDDTKAFTVGHEAFAISIACVYNGIPVIGVVYAPARERMYYAEKDKGAFMECGAVIKQIFGSAQTSLSESCVIIKLPSSPDRPLDKIVRQVGAKAFIEDGSIALALGRIAAGDAECTICTNPRVSKWDSAAGQAILMEVGGVVSHIDGSMLNYKQLARGWERLVVGAANPSIHGEFINQLNA